MKETAEQVIAELRAGNERFLARKPRTRVRVPADTADGQQPSCVVLTCSDSRVPPEVILDHDLGDLFVVRVAGNVASEAVMASVEFAVAQFSPSLLLVMGHTGCGALAAACAHAKDGQSLPSESLRRLVRKLLPSVDATKDGDPVTHGDRAAAHNALSTAAELRASPIVHGKVAEGLLAVATAIYDVRTGKVEFTDPEPAHQRPLGRKA